MQGSLDLPPIVIRSSRTTSALMLLVSAGFVAIGASMVKAPAQNHVYGYLAIAFFGLGIPLFTWRFIRPDTLTLTPEGIVWRSLVRTARWNWSDLRDFRPYRPSPKSTVTHVGFDFAAGVKGGQFRQAAKALTGVGGSLGGGWELGAAEICDLLNQARARWIASGPRARPDAGFGDAVWK